MTKIKNYIKTKRPLMNLKTRHRFLHGKCNVEVGSAVKLVGLKLPTSFDVSLLSRMMAIREE
jgi:hypothetical protein